MDESKKLIKIISLAELKPVIDKALLKKPVSLDLSDYNKELEKLDTLNTQVLQQYIDSKVKMRGGTIGVGGYLEQRERYSNSKLFQNVEGVRSIHLGTDIWTEAGTAIYAPLNSTVHSFQNNSNYLDYGPTLILQHQLDGLVFHTLYGHLTKQSLENLETGKPISAGEQLGALGEPHENGDWPPHLHFQIILDIQGNSGDYPGVSSKNEISFYKENCPDPNLILRLNL